VSDKQTENNIRSPVSNQLTKDNLKHLDPTLKIITKGGGGSVFSDAMSQLSKYKQRLKDLTNKTKIPGIHNKFT
jgi:hypothetical protein